MTVTPVRRLPKYLTFPNVIAAVCLFVVLGGPAQAERAVSRVTFAAKAGNASASTA